MLVCLKIINMQKTVILLGIKFGILLWVEDEEDVIEENIRI
jgi:hypothetical protein